MICQMKISKRHTFTFDTLTVQCGLSLNIPALHVLKTKYIDSQFIVKKNTWALRTSNWSTWITAQYLHPTWIFKYVNGHFSVGNSTRKSAYFLSLRRRKITNEDDNDTVTGILSHLNTRYEHYNKQYINHRHTLYCCINCRFLCCLVSIFLLLACPRWFDWPKKLYDVNRQNLVKF